MWIGAVDSGLSLKRTRTTCASRIDRHIIVFAYQNSYVIEIFDAIILTNNYYQNCAVHMRQLGELFLTLGIGLFLNLLIFCQYCQFGIA